MSLWGRGPSCFGMGVGQGWQEEPHSHSGFISEKGRVIVFGVTFLWDLGCLQKATTGYLGDEFGRCFCASGRQTGSLAGKIMKLCKFNIISGVNERAAPPSAQLFCKLVLWWTWQLISKVIWNNVPGFLWTVTAEMLSLCVFSFAGSCCRPQYLTSSSRNTCRCCWSHAWFWFCVCFAGVVFCAKVIFEFNW